LDAGDQHYEQPDMSMLASIRQNFRFNQANWKAVALCFFAATVFWFFNALNKNYSTNINFPLEFDYDRENFIPVSPLPNHVRINVSGIGWDLFRRSAGLKVPPLVIPLERPADIKKIVAVPGLFAHQLERFEINFVLSDTLRLAIEPIETRWITLRLDAKSVNVRKGFVRTSNLKLAPDSIQIIGPAPVIKSFIEPVYLRLADQNIDGNYDEDVEVELLHNELIKRNPPTVNVQFSVDRFIEISDSIPLRVINFPPEANPYLGIKGLPCRYSVPEKLMSTYVPDSVFAVVDLKNFTRGTQRLKPNVIGLPPYSQVEEIDSVYVKF
jgi:hypothetical protein